MKAMVATRFGGPDVLRMQEVETPRPGPGEILVRVLATSVNPVDCKLREDGTIFGIEPPVVLGFDASGIVEEAGPGAGRFRPGDAVFYTGNLRSPHGCNAEYHVVDEEIVARKPEHLTHEEAAAIPLAAGTAWQALVDRGRLRLGQSVLIHGAGGVGGFAVQLAVAAGARVLVSCSQYMVPTVRDWGAEKAVAYQDGDFAAMVREATDGRGVDLVFNTVGRDLITRSIPVTAEGGTLVGILNPEGDLDGAYRKNLTIALLLLRRERATMDALRTLTGTRAIRPLVDSVVELADLAEAHRRLMQGGIRGKIVVRISPEASQT